MNNSNDIPPEWQNIELPSKQVLWCLTDAHCHPTDVPFPEETVQNVGLGGLASMATRTTDQDLVAQFSLDHGLRDEDEDDRAIKRTRRPGPETIACFGYHPWFSHLLHLGEESNPPIKSDHYSSIFLPSSSSKQYGEQKKLLDDILPDLPEPIAVKPLIGKMREHVKEVWKRGGRAMIGEVGIDRSFRVPFPGSRPNQCQCEQEADVPKAEATIAVSGQEELAEKNGKTEEIKRSKNLTPFRPSIEHQIGLLQLQMDLALELGINVSLHSVKAQGPTLDYLKEYKKKHGAMFIDRINVDVHSCGGWSVESWGEAERHFPNLFLSPSIAISGRTPVTPHLIRAADPDRLLVESDTHLIQDTTKRVWAAAVWIANCRGWRIERTAEDLQSEPAGPDGEQGVVKRLEANWERFNKSWL